MVELPLCPIGDFIRVNTRLQNDRPAANSDSNSAPPDILGLIVLCFSVARYGEHLKRIAGLPESGRAQAGNIPVNSTLHLSAQGSDPDRFRHLQSAISFHPYITVKGQNSFISETPRPGPARGSGLRVTGDTLSRLSSHGALLRITPGFRRDRTSYLQSQRFPGAEGPGCLDRGRSSFLDQPVVLLPFIRSLLDASGDDGVLSPASLQQLHVRAHPVETQSPFRSVNRP